MNTTLTSVPSFWEPAWAFEVVHLWHDFFVSTVVMAGPDLPESHGPALPVLGVDRLGTSGFEAEITVSHPESPHPPGLTLGDAPGDGKPLAT